MLQHKNLFHPRSQTQFFPLRIWINDEFLDNFLHLPSKKLSIPDSNQNETKRHDCSQIELATPEQLIHPICKKKKSPNQDKKQKKKDLSNLVITKVPEQCFPLPKFHRSSVKANEIREERSVSSTRNHYPRSMFGFALCILYHGSDRSGGG